MENFIITKAVFEDAEKVSSLIVELLEAMNSNRKDRFIIDADLYRRVTSKILVKDEFAAFLAYSNTNTIDPIGVITIVESLAIYNLGNYGTITELFVKENYRSHGLGSLLINTAKQYCLNRGWAKLEVGAPLESEWPQTMQFYKANEFKEKGPKLRLEITATQSFPPASPIQKIAPL